VENPERKCRIKSTQYFTLEENKKKKRRTKVAAKPRSGTNPMDIKMQTWREEG